MNEEKPDADRLIERMAEVRTNLDRNTEKLFHGARTLGDWRYYVRTYPWVSVGAAAAVGFLLAPGKRPKPQKAKLDTEALEKLLKRKKLVVQAPSPKQSGLMMGLAGMGVRMLAQMAARELSQRMQAGWERGGSEEPAEEELIGEPLTPTRRSSKPR